MVATQTIASSTLLRPRDVLLAVYNHKEPSTFTNHFIAACSALLLRCLCSHPHLAQLALRVRSYFKFTSTESNMPVRFELLVTCIVSFTAACLLWCDKMDVSSWEKAQCLEFLDWHVHGSVRMWAASLQGQPHSNLGNVSQHHLTVLQNFRPVDADKRPRSAEGQRGEPCSTRSMRSMSGHSSSTGAAGNRRAELRAQPGVPGGRVLLLGGIRPWSERRPPCWRAPLCGGAQGTAIRPYTGATPMPTSVDVAPAVSCYMRIHT